MPVFISRLVEWLQARSTGQKALIVIVALVVLVFVSPLAVLIATVVLLISLVVLGLRMVYRGPLRGPAIIAAVSLVAVGLFSGISAVTYGDQSQEPTEVREVPKDPVGDPEPEPDPGSQLLEVPDSVDYRVAEQTGDDDLGFSVRTWAVETENDSLGALCSIAQDAALNAGEGWDVVRVTSEVGSAYVRTSDAAPGYSETEGLLRCPVPGEIFVTKSPTLRPD